ncbi:MAG: hypothetical protein Kow00108_09240 [Calditrichia bacterium]
MKFVHLHCHSFFSLLDGILSPEQLIREAAYLRMPGLALTDHNNLSGAVRFYKNALEFGLKPVIGAELSLTDIGNIVVLVKNQTGYEHLSELITTGNLRGGHGKFQLTLNDVIKYKNGLIILLGGRKNKMHKLIQNKQIDGAFDLIRSISAKLGSEFYLELQQIYPSDVVFNRRLIDFAQTLQVPLVATNNVHFKEKKDWRLYQVLRAIDQNVVLTQVKDSLPDECYLKPMGEMVELFSHVPEAIQNSLIIMDKCNFQFKLGTPVFPDMYDHPEKPSFRILAEKVKEGLTRRYGENVDSQIKNRAKYELRTIKKLGFTDYFLIVEDIVQFCKENRIPCVGRGSAGDSLVAYLLDITQVDPIRYNLYFERFLNPGRKQPPDIDLDICWKNRDKVLEYVYERFGRDKTAMICTFNTFKLRSSVRDIAKVYGIPEEEIRLLTNYLPHYSKIGLKKTLESLAEFQHLRHQFFIYEEIFELSEQIKDFPRHLSIHAGGVIIAPDRITKYVPLEVAGKGLVISQMDMVDVEELGLVKMDLLGVRSLSIIHDVISDLRHLAKNKSLPLPEVQPEQNQNQPSLFQAEQTVRENQRQHEYLHELNANTGKIVRRNLESRLLPNKYPFLKEHENENALLDVKSIPENDQTTIEMLKNGYSMGCFQLESPGMRGLLKKLQMESMDDVIISVALIRPGAANSGMKDVFIKRRAGLIPTTYIHPVLKEILSDTLGVVIYQEQVMQIAHHVAGIPLDKADSLRRVMTKHRDRKEILQLRKIFIEGVKARGISQTNAVRLWQYLLNFTGYGFNKAHAATYGILAYQTAYLKKHFPVVFMTAVLNNQGGFYSRMAYMEEARRLGIKLQVPDVSTAQKEFTFFEDTIIVGLQAVYELSAKTIQLILAERRKMAFRSLTDFLKRVRPARNEAINLAKCGALRSLEPSEPAALLQIKLFYQQHKAVIPGESNQFNLKPYGINQRIFYEMEMLECAVTAHPLTLFKSFIPEESIPSYLLPQRKDKKITFCGWGVTSRTAETSDGKVVKFLTLEDEFGIVEVVIWEDVYKKTEHQIKGHGPFIVTGSIQSRVPGEMNIVADYVRKIELSKSEWETVLSE